MKESGIATDFRGRNLFMITLFGASGLWRVLENISKTILWNGIWIGRIRCPGTLTWTMIVIGKKFMIQVGAIHELPLQEPYFGIGGILQTGDERLLCVTSRISNL